MKQQKLTALLLCIAVLFTTACADTSNNNTENTEQEQGPAQPIYGYENIVREHLFTEDESGILYASYYYCIPMLGIINPDELSEENLAIAQRNVEAFNQKMQEILDESVAYGEEMNLDLEEGEAFSGTGMPLSDEKTFTITQTGRIISVVGDCYFYGGGAHPYVFTVTHTFDLTLGQFIDPTQIADNPEFFRTKAAELLLAKANSLGEEYTAGFFPDYAETISRWNDTSVRFDHTGMTVIFSVYELGPYVMGSVELHLTYEELAEALGEGGLAHLGVNSANS